MTTSKEKDYKILLVDDDIENLQALFLIFEQYPSSYKILQTNDSTKALEIATKTLPDLVITDWVMPNISGIDLIKQIKNEPKTQYIPVIITTALMKSSDDLQRGLEAGAVDFIKKPFESTELIARANSAILMALNKKLILETKNKELVENALYLVKNRKFVLDLNKLLKELDDSLDPQSIQCIKIVKELLRKTQFKISDDSLERFNIAFYSLHENFIKNIIGKFPNLTKSEVSLSALLRLGMSTKNIASILFQTADSVKVSRYRLRKKFDLDQTQNLQTFLFSF